MKLSEATTNVLKNFSDINQNILVKQGNKLNTMSTMKNIIGEAKIEESFERDFGIYDLNEFLGVMSLGKDPDLLFEDDSFVKVKSGNSTTKYFFSDPSILVTTPESFTPPETDCTFRISQDELTAVHKACAVLQLPDVVIRNDGGVAVIVATDLKNTTSHEHRIELNSIDFPANFHFKIDNLNMISGGYDMSVASDKNVSRWTHQTKQIEYWIALEATSGQ